MKTTLPRFEGRPVQVGTIRLTGRTHDRVGCLAHDEEVFLIVRARVADVGHGDARVNGADLFARKHILKADAVSIVEAKDGARMLEEAIALADERFGVPNLFNNTKDEEP